MPSTSDKLCACEICKQNFGYYWLILQVSSELKQKRLEVILLIIYHDTEQLQL